MISRERPMGFAIVLFFDSTVSEKIEALRNRIRQAAGLPDPADTRWRAHMTLAMFDSIASLEPVIRIMKSFSDAVPPFDIKMESVGWFPTPERVIFLSPVATRRLLDVHERLHRLLEREGLISQPYYRPGKWVPHTTLSAGLPAGFETTALEEILSSAVFGFAALDEVGLVEFDPIKYLATFPLAGTGAEG
jgi:2'-5' RNA ligase